MTDENNIITTDNPLDAGQQETLAVLLDVIIPASEDGRLPSAAAMDLATYINQQDAEFIPVLGRVLDNLREKLFTSLNDSERYQLVEDFSKADPAKFNTLLFFAYACYYQDDRVLEGIGLGKGPPFPRGNTIESGDLSLLDPVLKRPRLYRT